METQEIVADIAAGRHDGDLMKIHEAVQFRFVSYAAALRWKVTLDDLEVTEDDVSLDELAQVEQLTQKRWGVLDPSRSAQDLAALLVVCLVSRKGLSRQGAENRVKKLKANDMLDQVSHYEVSPVPLDSEASANT